MDQRTRRIVTLVVLVALVGAVVGASVLDW
jgi:hypothetical protein